MTNLYGTQETNGLTNGTEYHKARTNNHGGSVDWTTKGLKVTRLRLLSDPGYPAWDVSYCHGELDGQDVDVILPFNQLPKKGMIAAILKHAQRAGVYAKGLGILSNISTLN
jgi:hypothetical protein